jgi:hypothetical protein
MTKVTWNRFNDIASKYFTTTALFKIAKVHSDYRLGEELTKPVVKLMMHHALKADIKTKTQIDLMLNELF